MEAVLEAYKNYSYLSMTADPTDPMFKAANQLYQNATLTFIRNLQPKTEFALFDGYYSVDYAKVANYGDIACHAPGKEAYVDSSFSCAIFQLPFFLERIQFGYITLGFVIPILLISIFGGIKENYRWYFLNQTIWDGLCCYQFICGKPTLMGWSFMDYPTFSTCFYNFHSPEPFWAAVGGIFRDISHFALFIPILLLAFSRFLGIYFPNFYKKIFSKTYVTITFIIFSDVIFLVLISIRRLSTAALDIITDNEKASCKEIYCSSPNDTHSKCLQSNKAYFNCFYRANVNWRYWTGIQKNIPNFIPPIMFFLSNLFVFLLFLKIFCQLRYQLKHNRNVFLGTIKIAGVVAFQCFTTSALFAITSVQMALQIKATAAREHLIYEHWIYKAIPPWLFFLQYYPTTSSLNLVRILLDSIIVLTLLSGYSSIVIGFLKFLILCFTKPKNAFKILLGLFGKKNNTSLFVLTPHKRSTR